MRRLRDDAGLSLRALEKKAHYSATALNRAEKLPRRPTWEVVEGYVRGCGGSVEEFRQRWDAAGVTAIDDPLRPGDPDPRHVPPPTHAVTRPSGLRQVGSLVAVVAVLAVTVVLAALLFPPEQKSDRCPSPTTERETTSGTFQCVGLITNVASVRPEFGMSSVLAGINAQNAAIGNQPTVSLAYVLPLPDVPSSFSTQLRSELDGVRLAQQRANQRLDMGGDQPKIRVLVYNTGESNAATSDVLSAIDAPSSDIVGVLGLGQSRPETIHLIDELTSRLIAVFPARATADQLTTGPTGVGLFRVAPLNRDLVAAAVAQLPDDARVALLEDTSQDPYNTDLARSFTDTLRRDRPGARLVPLPKYDSALNAVGTAFNNSIAPSLCRTKVDSVFVAGRGADIEKFLIAVDNDSECQKRGTPITVLTGDDGVDVLDQLRRANDGLADPAYKDDTLNVELRDAFRDGRFIFRYAALTHPDLWSTSEFRGFPDFNNALRSFDPQRNPNGRELQEGSAMMGYDSTVVAIRCVRLAAADQSGRPSGRSKIVGSCYSFTTGNPIFGVGGRLGFNSSGLAVGRTVPVVEVKADGSAPISRTAPD